MASFDFEQGMEGAGFKAVLFKDLVGISFSVKIRSNWIILISNEGPKPQIA
jgi:hypothetical protein